MNLLNLSRGIAKSYLYEEKNRILYSDKLFKVPIKIYSNYDPVVRLTDVFFDVDDCVFFWDSHVDRSLSSFAYNVNIDGVDEFRSFYARISINYMGKIYEKFDLLIKNKWPKHNNSKIENELINIFSECLLEVY